MRILLLLLFYPICAAAQLNPAFVVKSNLSLPKMQASYDGMFAFEQNGKIGYMDKSGTVVVPAIYSYDSISITYGVIPYFYNGYAKAVLNRKCGMIDKTGKLVIPVEHENLTPYTQFGNFVLITKTIGGKKNYGVLTVQNKQLLPTEYEDIKFDTGMITVKQNGKWGLIDKSGKQLLPFEYNSLSYSPTDKVLIAEKGTQYGVIDLTGKWLFEKAKNIYTLYSSKYGMVQCKVSGKYGFLDMKGNEVIISRYDGAYDFISNGLAQVYKKKEGTSYTNVYGYIDKKGNEVIPVKYESLSGFSNGLVYVKDPETNRYGYMDKSGKWVLQPVYIGATSFDDFGGAWVKMTDDKYHYINKTGKDLGTLDEKAATYYLFGKDGCAIYENSEYAYTIIDKTGKLVKKIDDCDAVYAFSNGIAGYKSKANSKYGFIDINGNKIINPDYDGFAAFEEGFIKVEKKIDGKTKSGYIDNKGNVMLPIVYDAAGSFRNGWGLVKKDSTYFFVDKNGNLKDPPRRYNELYEFRSGYALGKITGKGTEPHTFYYINTQLKEEFSVPAKQAYLFWDDVAIISRDNVTYEMLNKKGEIFKTLTGVQTMKFSSDGMLAVKENGKWGYINNNGDVVVKAKYDSCETFKYGYGRVMMNKKWGIIDKSGTEIIEPKYENILPGENGLFIYFDKYWGVMDKTGKILIQPGYLTMNPFEKDRAMARFGKNYTILKSPLAK
jgi:WG containing repeat